MNYIQLSHWFQALHGFHFTYRHHQIFRAWIAPCRRFIATLSGIKWCDFSSHHHKIKAMRCHCERLTFRTLSMSNNIPVLPWMRAALSTNCRASNKDVLLLKARSPARETESCCHRCGWCRTLLWFPSPSIGPGSSYSRPRRCHHPTSTANHYVI